MRISLLGGTTFLRSRIVKMYSPAMAPKINAKGAPTGAPLTCRVYCRRQLRCLLTRRVISNIETWSRLKIGRRFSSALIMRRFFLSCRPFRLM